MNRVASVLRQLDARAYVLQAAPSPQLDELRAGVIGLDGDGVTIAKFLSESSSGCRVVAAYDRGIYPRGSSVHSTVSHGQHGTIRSLVERVPQNLRELEALGVPLVETIHELLRQVDVVFLMTRDGRPRLEQAAEVRRTNAVRHPWDLYIESARSSLYMQVLRARKPLFMDRPVASNLGDALVIFTLAAGFGVPCCSASPLRWAEGCRAARAGSLGTVVHADTSSPTGIDQEAIDAGHFELCWDAVHGVDMLFAAMGTGCTSVTYRGSMQGHGEAYEGLWGTDAQAGSRTGTYHHLDEYGGSAVTEDGRAHALLDNPASGTTAPAEWWGPMVRDIVRWFHEVDTGADTSTLSVLPSTQETLDVYTFIAAAEESKARGDGATVTFDEILLPAKKAAQVVLDREWYTPGTVRALGGGRLGAAPFLAQVSDEEAAMLTGRSIIDHRAERVSDEMATAAISKITEEVSWFGDSAEGFGAEPQWWEESVKKPPPVVESEEGKGEELEEQENQAVEMEVSQVEEE